MEKYKFTDLSEFKDVHELVAFHFTANQNIDSIMENGFEPRIGDNSSEKLGKEAIKKVFISYGLEGVLQMYNRLLNIAVDVEGQFLNTNSHRPFLPNTVDLNEQRKLSVLEGLEFMRQYIENNSYIVIDCPITEYEKNISYDEMKTINKEIGNLRFEDIQDYLNFEKVKQAFSDGDIDKFAPEKEQEILEEYIDHIDEIIDNAKTDEEKAIAEKLSQIRSQISIAIRQYSLKKIDNIRGKMTNENENPLVEKCDYNEKNLKWIIQVYDKDSSEKRGNPSNTHTRIVEGEEGLIGLSITPENLHVFSSDGKTYATGIEFLRKIVPEVQKNDKIANNYDCDFISDFLAYVDLIEEYRKLGLLKRDEKQLVIGDKTCEFKMEVLDIENLEMYPGFEERFHSIEQSIAKKELEKSLEHDVKIKYVPSLIEKYEKIDGISEKMDYIRKKIEGLDWDNSILVEKKDGTKDQIDDVTTMLLYEYASSLEELSGVPFEQIVDKITSINGKVRLGNWRSPNDDILKYDNSSVTSSDYQNGERKKFGAQAITYVTSENPNEKPKNQKALVLYSNQDEYGNKQNGIDLNNLNDIRQTLFREWTHVMEMELVNENDDNEYVLNGRTFRGAEKLSNGEVWHTGLVTREFGKNLTIVQDIDRKKGKQPRSRIMHNQITEGVVELIARKILRNVIGKERTDKEIDDSRYMAHVNIAQTMMDSYGEKDFISKFITTPSKLTRDFELARIGREDALHYMADFVDDQMGFQVIPEYAHRTAIYRKMANMLEKLSFSDDEKKDFQKKLEKAQMDGNAVEVLGELLKTKVDNNLNDSKLQHKTWAFLSSLDENGRNPIRVVLDEYNALLTYEKDYYQSLPVQLKRALDKSRNRDGNYIVDDDVRE